MKLSKLLTCNFFSCLLVSIPLLIQAQAIRVTGKVKTWQGEPLPGTTIAIKGTAITTTSSYDGSYAISAPSATSILAFNYVGFEVVEETIGDRTDITVFLKPDNNVMQGVVVVGYGSQRKSDVTGSLSSISSKVFEERPVTNALQAMQGKAAGVNITTNIKPGELPVLRVRGNRSITASNEPLYVVDGIPIVSILGVTSFSINDINPLDIASMEILKDASATAIYGSRGANGVVLITTKKGIKGKASINYNTTLSLDRYHSLTDWMDGGQWVDRWREALINGRNYQPTGNTNLNVAPTSWYPDPFLDRTKMSLASDLTALQNVWSGYEWDVYGVTPKKRAATAEEKALGWPDQVPVYDPGKVRSFDWLDAVTRTGITQSHQLSLAAGNEISRLYMSMGYNDQKGVQRDQDFKRFNVNLNGDINATKWLDLGISMVASLSRQNYGISTNSSNTGSKDLYSRAAEQFRYAQPRDSNGLFIRNAGGNLNLWNPVIDIGQVLNERRTASIMANTFAEVKLAPGLRYRLNFGTQLRTYRTGAWTGPQATGHLTAVGNTAGYTRDENFSWVAENLLYYDVTLAKIHALGLTFLQSAQQSRRENTAITVAGTISPSSLWYDLGATSQGKPTNFSTGYTENTLASFMGRVNYTLMDKYLLTASVRYDGSSVLAPGHKWDVFPSFALAWKMQNENFLKHILWIGELKPRFGFGVTGNSAVPPYNTSGPLSRNPYVFGSNPSIGYLPQLAKNPILGWEKTEQVNIGLDFSLVNNRLTGVIDLYEARTSDLLLVRQLLAVTGYAEKYENVGKTKNRGLEITLSSVNMKNKDFRWTTDLNFSTNSEKIIELLNGKEDILASRLFIGQPITSFYHYDNAGIWSNTKEDLDEMAKFNAKGHRFYPGTIRVKDQNNDYRINADDYVIRGNNRPKWSGGITNTFRYKSWLLSCFVYAKIGQTYFGGYPNSYGGVTPNGRVEKDVWSYNNPGGRWPIAINGPAVDNFTPAMQFNNGSFVAVRNISLSYTVTTSAIKRAGVKNLQLNVQVVNPFIFGGDVVKWGINPDDDTNWDLVSQANTNNAAPVGGTNNNTILPQSLVFGIRAGF